jgi:hypothetical protein
MRITSSAAGHEISIERDLMDAFVLKRKVRKRIYRLWMEMEMFRG